MITADDPRHGENRGYNAGCREECCRHAHMVYAKRWRLGYTRGLLDPTGTHRRLQALAALGHSMQAVSTAAGHHKDWALRVLRSSAVHPRTAALIADVYEQLSMQVPKGFGPSRIRNRAAAEGWVPPLAWDDIDHDPAPVGVAPPEAEGEPDVDEVAIQRRMSGDTNVRLTRAERRLFVQRWIAAGRPISQLDTVHGINPQRELQEAAA